MKSKPMSDTDFTLPEGTHTVVIGVGDLNGIMRGKRLPASHWPAACKEGIAFSLVLLAADMTSDVWDTPYVNFDNGYPDMHVFPAATPVAVPWEEGVAFCMGRCEGMDHQPVPIDPRQVLLRQMERARAMGFDPQIGPEVEFYLLDPETRQPRDEGIDVYGLARAAQMEHVLGPIRTHINDMGIAIEQSNAEYAAGQMEVNLRYCDTMVAADRIVAFRYLVKQLAAEHGYLATFMAKPFYDSSGNGFHTHHSLWRDGENAFSDGGRLNDTGRHYLAGMQARMVETALIGSTTPNAYRRRQPMSFCPINTTWSIDNRTTGLRVIEGSPKAVRVEKRDASADCNPYLLFAGELASGLDGIEGAQEPEHFVTGNAYHHEEAPKLPNDIRDAIASARGSDWMKALLGDHLHELLCQQSEREMGFVAAQVTPVETARYLKAF